MASEQDMAFMRMALEEAVKGRETPGGAEVALCWFATVR